jgi:hypothetical protein
MHGGQAGNCRLQWLPRIKNPSEARKLGKTKIENRIAPHLPVALALLKGKRRAIK